MDACLFDGDCAFLVSMAWWKFLVALGEQGAESVCLSVEESLVYKCFAPRWYPGLIILLIAVPGATVSYPRFSILLLLPNLLILSSPLDFVFTISTNNFNINNI